MCSVYIYPDVVHIIFVVRVFKPQFFELVCTQGRKSSWRWRRRMLRPTRARCGWATSPRTSPRRSSLRCWGSTPSGRTKSSCGHAATRSLLDTMQTHAHICIRLVYVYRLYICMFKPLCIHRDVSRVTHLDTRILHIWLFKSWCIHLDVSARVMD